jgi:YtfJ family uncharacterized protein
MRTRQGKANVTALASHQLEQVNNSRRIIMTLSRFILCFVLALTGGSVLAAPPTVDSALPLLDITERGELTMSGDDFKFVPWRSDTDIGKVHVIQYFGATMGDQDTFKPFTDLLERSFESGTIHVTTVLNLDAAMWGTSGFVVSELKKNKRIYPQATMVLDDDGSGVVKWDLGEAGTGLIVANKQGIVKFFSPKALSKDEMAATVELIRTNLDG